MSSCYILLGILGHKVEYQDLARAIPIDQRKGSNLFDIKRGCAAQGLNAEVRRVTPGQFDEVRWPAIAHLIQYAQGHPESGHFVVVLRVDARNVYFIDPSYGAITARVARGNFFRYWSGYLLVPMQSGSSVDYLGVAGLVCLLASLAMAARILGPWRSTRDAPKSAAATPAAIVAALLISLAPSGCSRPPDRPTGPGVGQEDGPIIMAWKYEADLGVVAADVEAGAKFPIENIGSRLVELEVGMPSCTCGRANIGKTRLAAGESTELRMTMRPSRNAGPVEASVQVVALVERWAQTFLVKAIRLGSTFPNETIVLTTAHVENPYDLIGKVYAGGAGDRCEVAVTPLDRSCADFIKISPAVLSDPTPEDGYHTREIRISIRCVREGLARLRAERKEQMEVGVKLNGVEQRFPVTILLEPSTAS